MLRHSQFAPQIGFANVLVVGAERSDEFAEARQLLARGHNVTVINPRESLSAFRFSARGGAFIRCPIERLPLTLGPFDVICENYPFTVARVEGVCEDDPCPMWLSARLMRAYAMARLRHLAPGGRWILFTESPGFARALRSILRRDSGARHNFSAQIVPLTGDQAPQSSYPRLPTRFKVILQRHPARSHRTSSVPARKAYS